MSGVSCIIVPLYPLGLVSVLSPPLALLFIHAQIMSCKIHYMLKVSFLQGQVAPSPQLCYTIPTFAWGHMAIETSASFALAIGHS